MPGALFSFPRRGRHISLLLHSAGAYQKDAGPTEVNTQGRR
jgi:hypothetical protein